MINAIIDFIRARLDEEEAVAKAAALGGRWHYADGDSIGAWSLYDRHWRIATMTVYRRVDYNRFPAKINPSYIDPDAIGTHIARNDPERVLLRIEAMRQLLDYLVDLEDKATTCNWWSLDTETPFKLLAAEWDQHADYRPEWRVQ